MIIAGIQKLSLIDYPDEPAVVIFTAGCNLDCGYCHNPELKTTNIETIIDDNWLIKFLKDRKKYIDHLVITGGEPLINKDLKKYIELFKDLGFKVKLDTNGTIPIPDDILEIVDFIAIDIKGTKNDYGKIVNKNVDLNVLEDNINKIKSKKSKNPYLFRTTINEITTEDKIDEIKKDWNVESLVVQEYNKYINK